jgi:hypothetical protein
MGEKKGINAPERSRLGFMGEKKGINTPERSGFSSASEKKKIGSVCGMNILCFSWSCVILSLSIMII